MASVICSGLALFILTSYVVQVGSYPKRYTSVIAEVHQYYRTSSVLFVFPRDNRCLENNTSVHSLSLDFSRKYDSPSIFHFEQFNDCPKRHHKRSGRPLQVVFLYSLSDIAEFTNNTKFTNEPSIWLVIFTDESGSSELCEYCKSPKGNSFRLRFDTEILVLCCDGLVLQQWWSIDGDHTEVSEVAVWKDKNRGKLRFHERAVIDARRYDVKGAGLRIGLVEDCIFAYEVDKEIRGLFGEILTELQHFMNFTITEIVRSPTYGSWDSKTKISTGLVGRLIQGEVDLGVADFTVNLARLDVLDFTLPLAKTKGKLYIRDEGGSDAVYWTGYFEVFSVNIWIATILVMISAMMLLAVISLFKSSRSSRFSIVECYLHVWGIICQQSLNEFPAELPLRITYLSMFTLALVIFAAYSASLVSFLAILPSGLPFMTLEGFVNDGSYRLISLRNSSLYDFFSKTTDPVFKGMMKSMKPVAELPDTLSAAWKQVCQSKVAFFYKDLPLPTSQITTMCNLAVIPTDYINDRVMIMPAGSQYSRAINHYIQRFKDVGVIDRINHKYDIKNPSSVAAELHAVNLWDVIPVLVLLTCGLILALLVLLCEAMYNVVESYRRNRRRGKNFRNSRLRITGNAQLPFIH